MKKTTYILTMPQGAQDLIHSELLEVLQDTELVEMAMDSRLCDLEDTIDIKRFL